MTTNTWEGAMMSRAGSEARAEMGEVVEFEVETSVSKSRVRCADLKEKRGEIRRKEEVRCCDEALM